MTDYINVLLAVEDGFDKAFDKLQDEMGQLCVAQVKLKDRLRAVEAERNELLEEIEGAYEAHAAVEVERDAYKAFFDAWLGGRMDKAASYQSALNIMSSDDFRHR